MGHFPKTALQVGRTTSTQTAEESGKDFRGWNNVAVKKWRFSFNSFYIPMIAIAQIVSYEATISFENPIVPLK